MKVSLEGASIGQNLELVIVTSQEVSAIGKDCSLKPHSKRGCEMSFSYSEEELPLKSLISPGLQVFGLEVPFNHFLHQTKLYFEVSPLLKQERNYLPPYDPFSQSRL